MGRNVPIHTAGSHYAEDWVFAPSDKTLDDVIGEAKSDQRVEYLLCSLVKELREVNYKLDMLDPDIRQKYIERKRQKAKEKADREAHYDERFELARSRRSWFLPVAERLVARHAPPDLASQLRRKIRSSAEKSCIGYYPHPHEFLDYVKALKGPPEQWNLKAFHGIGPAFVRTWKQALANGSGTIT